ncbi:MAG: amylo-alpha-1,6-glucosidase [Thermoleophilia bacterium]|nr:amylo-alpha-1,6-glucosidase [Thermoleophilia bacterium]
MTLTILEGSTFCICDDLGDIGTEETSGFFHEDVRHLSRLRLTINGEPPLLLAAKKVEYFSAAFYLRNPVLDGLAQDSLLIARERFVGEAMQDRIRVWNETLEPVVFELALELAADFADMFTVKDRDFALGNPERARPLPPPAEAFWDADHNQVLFSDPDPSWNEHTQVIVSRPAEANGAGLVYRIELEPRAEWKLVVDVVPTRGGDPVRPPEIEGRFGHELAHVRESLAAWELRVPQLRATWDALQHAFGQSVADLAALRLRSNGDQGKLPAAGMPWFMTVFGRDTIVASLQTLLFGPELARAALCQLAELQADAVDAAIDAEPGKIVHEVRTGKTASVWFERYYGTVDATPLYLILLSEVWRWTDDLLLVRELHEPALKALRWIDEHGDRDGDGFVEYERRTPRGLANQSWKDSGDSQRFADGRFAQAPIAPCEVQGYVYDAKRRTAELAREVWRDRELAGRLEAEADELRRRFDEAFWVEGRGGHYALALDADKRPVDALTSNIGHLLWSGIVPPERVDAVVDALMGEALWSGWGVRTMSSEDAAYNPLSYHNGSVWPHDNSLIAAGLARQGRWREAQRIARRMLEASAFFGHQLPEVFAGLRRSDTPFPVPYPTAARPQAWAAGTPVLLLQLLLGLVPDPRLHTLTTVAPPELPAWAGSVRLTGVRAFDAQWEIRLEEGTVNVEELE